MSVPIYTIKAEVTYSEEEAVMMWLRDRGYVAVDQRAMSVLGASDYQRAAGLGPVTLYDTAKNRYEKHPELELRLRK